MLMNAHSPVLGANDNSPFDLQFLLPDLFVKVYQTELMDWARTRRQHCKVRLWNRPGVTMLDMSYWPEVTLRLDAYGDQITKRMKFLIQPDTDQDREIVTKHCAALPNILEAQHAAAAADRGTRKNMARWAFDGTVPEYFVHRYQAELRAWAANFKKIGTRKHIVLREGNLSDISPNPEHGAVLLRVALLAKIDRKAGDDFEIVVSAASDQDEALIAKHCEKLQKAGIPSGMVLVEPERAGIPFLPKIDP